METAIRNAVAGAVRAEVGWQGPDGMVWAAARTPLVGEAGPALALTYDDLDVARCLAAAPRAVLTISDARVTLAGWQALSVPVQASLIHDPDGERFVADLVEQELAKFPPSRLRADSLLQRRENWWYLARVIVSLQPRGPAQPVTARVDPDTGVAYWAPAGALHAATVSVSGWERGHLRVGRLDGGAFTGARAAPAAVLRHDASPDQERRAAGVAVGRLDNTVLTVEERRGDPALGPVPGVWRRVRAARAFERACRQGLAAAGY